MAARGFIGAGDIYIERMVAGVSQGLAGPYYANKFEIKPNVDKKEQTSKGRNDYGQVLESVTMQKPAGFTLELSEVNTESLTLALLGTASASSQASGTLTDALVTVKLDRWVPVGKESLTGIVVVKSNDATPITRVEGVDYLINKPLGLIKAVVGGAILDAAIVKVTSTYGAITSTKISGATNTDIRAKIIFDGKNQADGLPVVVTVWEAIIAADSAFDFLANDFNTVNLPGTMKTPTGKTEPFVVELRNAA
jgi:hypothetical protein